MATLTAEEITDLVNTTQRDLGRMKMTDLSTDLQEHVAMNNLMRKNRVSFNSGTAIQFNVLMNADNNARNVGLFDVDNVNQVDGVVTGNVPWRHSVAGYTFDRRQLLMNRTPARVLDFVKVKRYQQMVALVELMEQNFWGEPAASTDDETPFGLKYWLVYNATAGFTGANNTNFTSGPAGISRTTYPRWKNYTGLYTNITKVDLVRAWRKAATLCAFKPAVTNINIASYNTGNKYGYYTNYDVIGPLEEALEDQNMSLGNDIASKDGMTMFRRIPVDFVPWLQDEESTADPVVGINWGVFKTVFLSGAYMTETPLKVNALSHNVMESFLDCTYNFICYDCRRNFALMKSTWH